MSGAVVVEQCAYAAAEEAGGGVHFGSVLCVAVCASALHVAGWK